MSQRVLGTDEARQAAQQLKQLVDGDLSDVLKQMRVVGQSLSNPQVWDSPIAQDFRGSQWPGMQHAIEAELKQLDQLGDLAARVISDILKAGGDGAGGEAGTGEGGKEGGGEGESVYEKLGGIGEMLGVPLAVTGAMDLGALHVNTVKVLSRLRSANSEFAAARDAFTSAEEADEASLKAFQAASKELLAARAGVSKIADGFFDTFAKLGEEASEEASKAVQLLSKASGVLKWAGRSIGGLAVVGDVLTLINPGKDVQGGMRVAVRAEAGVNLGATGVVLAAGTEAGGEALAAAGLSWVPVAGQVLAVGTALVIAYQTIKPFHDFVNGAVSDVGHVATAAWHGVTNAAHAVGGALKSAGSAVAHFFGF